MSKIAFYAGSFNPMHLGHLNVLEKSMRLFGEKQVVVMLGQNPTKSGNPAIESRAKHLNKRLKCDVVSFTGLLTDAMIQQAFNYGYGPQDIVLIRGLRNGYDLDSELVQWEFLKDLSPDLQIVFIPCDKEFNHISSTALRALADVSPFGLSAIHKYVV
jgi:pantetheine-phosphate adenylyltransferase